MYKNRILFVAMAIVFISQLMVAQNNTNSPYTRFGFGALADNNSAELRAMGGISLGHRSIHSINSVNPASYSVVDSLTFMFDLGASSLISHFSTVSGSQTKINANLEYINMQFPLSKWMAVSAGLQPYSFTGYKFEDNQMLPFPGSTTDSVASTRGYLGYGGISQVYAGVSFDFLNHVALGVNAYYMFGNIYNERTYTTKLTSNSSIAGSSAQSTISVSDFRFRFGAQFFNTFNKKHDVTLGLIFEPKKDLKCKNEQTFVGAFNDTINLSNSNFDLPLTYGIGLNYSFNKQLTVGLDYSMQQWKDARYFGEKNSLSNRSNIALGFEYIPNPKSRKFLQRVHYRAGVNMSDSYYNVNNTTLPKDIGVSVGFGILPVNQSLSMLNATIEYGKIGNKSLMREDFFKITVGITINEYWFFKRKL